MKRLVATVVSLAALAVAMPTVVSARSNDRPVTADQRAQATAAAQAAVPGAAVVKVQRHGKGATRRAFTVRLRKAGVTYKVDLSSTFQVTRVHRSDSRAANQSGTAGQSGAANTPGADDNPQPEDDHATGVEDDPRAEDDDAGEAHDVGDDRGGDERGGDDRGGRGGHDD